MNWLKSGPELKMPSFKGGGPKAPDFLVDLYWDLRDRHLLPLVALAIVAIIAVPFLLGGDSEEEPIAPRASAIAAVAGASSAKLTVVEAKPGLRDYRKRLRERKPTDPFKQRYTAPVLDGTELGDGKEGEGSSSTNVTKTSTSTTKTTKTTGGDTTTTTTTTETDGVVAGEVVLFSFAVNLKIVRTETKPDGHKEKKTSKRERVLPPAPLPGTKSQVVTYMGISPKSQKPLFLISDVVTGVFGEGTCISGADTCQLLEVETGLPVTFVDGKTDVRYKITILKVEPVVAGKLDSGGK